MSILITGGAGYIGSILVRELLKKGYRIRIMDTLKFGIGPIKGCLKSDNVQLFPGDIRNYEDIEGALEDVEAVIHLAAIVGDPACAVQADNALETNYLSTMRLAKKAKDKGVSKFIFASTCSVYGACDEILTEGSELNPQSLYAETKILSEKGLMELKDNQFNPIILRLGTLYGLSYRPRFDLVINYLTGKIITENRALIFGGDQWRPFIHVTDIARSFVFSHENYEKMEGEVFNVGSNSENYQMKDIGVMFEEIFPEAEIKYIEEIRDSRSYRVSFDKIQKMNFRLTKTVKPSIYEMKNWVIDNDIDPKSPEYYNYHP